MAIKSKRNETKSKAIALLFGASFLYSIFSGQAIAAAPGSDSDVDVINNRAADLADLSEADLLALNDQRVLSIDNPDNVIDHKVNQNHEPDYQAASPREESSDLVENDSLLRATSNSHVTNKEKMVVTKTINDARNNYSPYLEVGGTRFFNVNKYNSALGVDAFIPLWQTADQLIFTDIRFYDRSGTPFEGNLHLGYRYLSPEKQHVYGIYGAFDRKKTGLGNYFNQLTIGAECWLQDLFIGGNFYQPVGDTSRLSGISETAELVNLESGYKGIWVTTDKKYEKAMGGADAEIGYELLNGLVAYVGGYYFKASGVDSMIGPKAKLAYDWRLCDGHKILGIFDKIGLEVGVHSDKPRGTIWHVGANFRIGLLPNSNTNLPGVARHMVDVVRRDVDIIATDTSSKSGDYYREDGKIVAFASDDSTSSMSSVSNTGARRSIIDQARVYKNVGSSYYEFVSSAGIRHSVDMASLYGASQESLQGDDTFLENSTKNKGAIDLSFIGGKNDEQEWKLEPNNNAEKIEPKVTVTNTAIGTDMGTGTWWDSAIDFFKSFYPRTPKIVAEAFDSGASSMIAGMYPRTPEMVRSAVDDGVPEALRGALPHTPKIIASVADDINFYPQTPKIIMDAITDIDLRPRTPSMVRDVVDVGVPKVLKNSIPRTPKIVINTIEGGMAYAANVPKNMVPHTPGIVRDAVDAGASEVVKDVSHVSKIIASKVKDSKPYANSLLQYIYRGFQDIREGVHMAAQEFEGARWY